MLDGAAAHGGPHVPFETFSVGAEVFSRFFVEGVRGVGFEEEELWVIFYISLVVRFMDMDG